MSFLKSLQNGYYDFRGWCLRFLEAVSKKRGIDHTYKSQYRILYKFASRSRPKLFFRTLDNITKLARHDNYLVLASLDLDDETMNNDEVKSKLCNYPKMKACYGTSRNKIDAINRDMEQAGQWDIVVNLSDDMMFMIPGFDIEISKDFEREGLDVLMHYPDNKVGEGLITMAVMGRDYYNRFGFIYHPAYKSLFCDNEQMQVAKILGRHRFVNKRIFNHYHPGWQLAKRDALYLHAYKSWDEDEQTFLSRQKQNFGL